MASLKEIKARISSTKSTQKVTSAMKMVASAKLSKAKSQIDNFFLYEHKLKEILNFLLASDDNIDVDLAIERKVKTIAIVVFSSNSGLCGAFNANIEKLLTERLDYYKNLGVNIEIYALGKKVEEYIQKNYPSYPVSPYNELIDKPNYDGIKELAEQLITEFRQKKIDKVELLYNHYKSVSTQVSSAEQFLPILFKNEFTSSIPAEYYIIEPDREMVLNSLLPKALYSQMYVTLLDSVVAEQASRMVAMQIATDNASELLDELTVQYNKQRQLAITNELLDIVGGSEALD